MNDNERYARALIRIYNAFPPINGRKGGYKNEKDRKRELAISFARKKILNHGRKTGIIEFRVQVNRYIYNVVIKGGLLNVNKMWVIPFGS